MHDDFSACCATRRWDRHWRECKQIEQVPTFLEQESNPRHCITVHRLSLPATSALRTDSRLQRIDRPVGRLKRVDITDGRLQRIDRTDDRLQRIDRTDGRLKRIDRSDCRPQKSNSSKDLPVRPVHNHRFPSHDKGRPSTRKWSIYVTSLLVAKKPTVSALFFRTASFVSPTAQPHVCNLEPQRLWTATDWFILHNTVDFLVCNICSRVIGTGLGFERVLAGNVALVVNQVSRFSFLSVYWSSRISSRSVRVRPISHNGG